MIDQAELSQLTLTPSHLFRQGMFKESAWNFPTGPGAAELFHPEVKNHKR